MSQCPAMTCPGGPFDPVARAWRSLARRVLVPIVIPALVAAAGCSSSSGTPPGDAGSELGNPCPRVSCGNQCCDSVGQLCSPACACPDGSLVPVPFTSSIQVIDPNQVPGSLTAIALFTVPDGTAYTLVVGYRPELQLGTDFQLPGADGTPFAAIGWRVNVAAQTSLTAYYATAGMLNLTSACAAGVAGTLSNLTFTEQRATRDQTPLPGGCTFSVNNIDFVIGGSCL